jgi:hypothetical protein
MNNAEENTVLGLSAEEKHILVNLVKAKSVSILLIIEDENHPEYKDYLRKKLQKLRELREKLQ